MKTLSAKAARAAHALREARPPVLEGTNTIPDDAARLAWYAQVKAAMKAHNIPAALIKPFCDIAGVPS